VLSWPPRQQSRPGVGLNRGDIEERIRKKCVPSWTTIRPACSVMTDGRLDPSPRWAIAVGIGRSVAIGLRSMAALPLPRHGPPNDEQDEASQVSRSQSYVPAQVIDGKTPDFAARGIRQAARRCFGFDRSPSETTEPAHRSAARTR
jgi:hypothetical protein